MELHNPTNREAPCCQCLSFAAGALQEYLRWRVGQADKMRHLIVLSKEADTSMRRWLGLAVPGPVGDHLMV